MGAWTGPGALSATFTVVLFLSATFKMGQVQPHSFSGEDVMGHPA